MEKLPAFEKPTSDYLRVMTASPNVHVGNPQANLDEIALAYQAAVDNQAELLVLPELAITGYSTADLFANRHVLRESNRVLYELSKITRHNPAMIVGAPVEDNGILYNCAVVLGDGRIQGIVPKSYLPNYNEFYEKRWFTSGHGITKREIPLDAGGYSIPFGTDLLFDINDTTVGVEVCEDGWAAISPGTHAALQGAEVIVNLSASNEAVGKAKFRRQLVTDHASRLICAYVYTSAGAGESVADTVWGGHQLIGENGRLVAEVKPFEKTNIVYDIDREYLVADRMVNKTFGDESAAERQAGQYRRIFITETPRPADGKLLRQVEGRPFGSPEACEEVLNIISQGLSERLDSIKSKGVVLGLSGGLDSTLAVIVAVEAAKKLGKKPDFVHTITMPGFASSERTQDNATLLAETLGTTHSIMPIGEISSKFLQTLGHDGKTEDITYENTQARTRTEILMNYANKIGGMVQGTGDLSESAQGWMTFNGDHMSMYNPNANVFKTMAKDIVRWYKNNVADESVAAVLQDILDTPISPELTGNGDLSQTTEDIIGPYELTEFFHVELQRRHSSPDKIGYLAAVATFENEYTPETIARWLDKWLTRYTAAQWKRDVAPNGIQTGSIGNSPRTQLRMAPNTDQAWYK